MFTQGFGFEVKEQRSLSGTCSRKVSLELNDRQVPDQFTFYAQLTMQQFDLLTSLPSTLSCIVLRDWLNLKSVMALDSAYCSHSCRSEFLSLLKSDEYFIREQVNIRNEDGGLFPVSHFFVTFGEKIRSVRFGSEQLALVHKGTLSTNCHHLIDVIVCGVLSEDIFGIDVANADEVNDDNNCFTPELCALLKNNPHIESLCFERWIEELRVPIPFLHLIDDIVLPSLTSLTVQGRQIEDEFILALMNARSVVQLNLRGCEFKVPILSLIAALRPQLEKLDLSAASGVTDDVLGEITILCPRIVELDVSDNGLITDAGVLLMVQNLKELHTLNVSYAELLTDASLVLIYTHCASTLHTLLLSTYSSFEPVFSGDAINTLLERCAQLCTVHLAGSDIAPFVFSPKALRNLTNLEIDCNIATEQNVAIICANGASLQRLRIIRNYEPTQDTVSNLVNGCPNLRELSMMVPLDPVESIPEYLTGAHWENIRPGLRIDLFVVVPTEIIV